MISGEQLFSNLKREEIIICDWDSVIQEIDIEWMKLVMTNKKIFDPYYNFDLLLNKEVNLYDLSLIKQRNCYYIDQYLKLKNVNCPPQVNKLFVSLYMNDDDFYNRCPFLTMAKALLDLSTQNFLKKIVFVSSAPKGIETDFRKQKQMENFFGKDNIKFELKVIHGDMKKSEFINEFHPNYTTFIDDRSDNVRDIIDNTDSSNKTFILPHYRYNEDLGNDKEYIKKCYDKGMIISTYLSEEL